MGACGGFETCASGFFECELLGSFRSFGGSFGGSFSSGFGGGEGAEVGEVTAEGSFGFKLWEKGVVVSLSSQGVNAEGGHNVHLE